MPDKRYAKGCGSSCLRCWHNRLKHANPTVKKYMKKHNLDSIHTDKYNVTLLELKLKNLEENGLTDSNEYNKTLLQFKLENEKNPGHINACEYNKMLSKLKSENQENSIITCTDNEESLLTQKPKKTNTRR